MNSRSFVDSMLLRFSVENHRPFREEAALDMVPLHPDQHPDNVIVCQRTGDKAVTATSLFGPNGSGKSCVLRALADLVEMVRRDADDASPFPSYDPFGPQGGGPSGPGVMDVEFVADGTKYGYNLSFDRDGVVSECLDIIDGEEPVSVFDRDGDVLTLRGSRADAVTRPRTLSLTSLSVAGDSDCESVRRFLSEGISVLNGTGAGVTDSILLRIREDGMMRDAIAEALDAADFGPVDIGSPEKMSSGTLRMVVTMAGVVDALRSGGVLIADDFCLGIHPQVSEWVVRLFSAPYNPEGAQLLFATHDMMLLETDLLLGWDQVHFADRDRATRESTLYRLSDFTGLREYMDMRKCYLSGRFEAFPYIGRADRFYDIIRGGLP